MGHSIFWIKQGYTNELSTIGLPEQRSEKKTHTSSHANMDERKFHTSSTLDGELQEVSDC